MIKKYGIGMAAVLIAISAAAFTTNKTHKPLTQQWFVLNSGNPANNTSYQLAPGGGADPGCPTDPNTVCAVLTSPDASNSNIPDQSQLTAIKTASSNFTKRLNGLEYVRP
jgi:hypothetical protein